MVAGVVALLVVGLVALKTGVAQMSFADLFGGEDRGVLLGSRLPRLVAGLLAGTALAGAGTLLQATTRNPLAGPETLAVNSGGYLALVATAAFSVTLPGLSRPLVALVGGLVAVILVQAVVGVGRVSAARLLLGGFAISLALSSVAAVLLLFHEQATAGLYLWGQGSLLQLSTGGPALALLAVGGILFLAMLLARPLDLLATGDDVARSLGVPVRTVRTLAIVAAVAMAAIAVSVTGPISFVGIVVPHLLRGFGVRRHRLLLPAAALWASVVVIAADLAGQWLDSGPGEIPAGVTVAIVAAPIFLVMARRVPAGQAGSATDGARPGRTRLPYAVLLPGLVGVLLVAVVAGLVFGDLTVAPADVLRFLTGGNAGFAEIVLSVFRLPRLLVAALAGAALASGGVLLQAVVRNSIAEPSVVGVTGGASLAAVSVVILLPAAPAWLLPAAAFVGGSAIFAAVYAVSAVGGRVAPARLVLVGIAASAAAGAGVAWLVSSSGLALARALVWLSGTTYGVSLTNFWPLLAVAVLMVPVLVGGTHRMDLLGLGDELPRSLGVRLDRLRLLLLAAAVLLTSAAVATVGAVSFVGLVAPHLARLLVGHRHARLVPVAALLGATLMVLADTVGRSVLAPAEIPSGLVVALIGTPYFVALLARSRRA
jgi:iron complex transport system permease protein